MLETLSSCYNPELLTLSEPMSLEDAVGSHHVTITLDETLAGCLVDGLTRAGIELGIVSASSSFVAALATVAAAPAITTMPPAVAARYAPMFGLRTCRPPIHFSSRAMSLAGRARVGLDPSAAWLREQIRSLEPFASSGIDATLRAPPEVAERASHNPLPILSKRNGAGILMIQ